MAAPEINREKNGETLKELLSIERNSKVSQVDAVDDTGDEVDIAMPAVVVDADGEVDIAMAAAAVVDADVASAAGNAGN